MIDMTKKYKLFSEEEMLEFKEAEEKFGWALAADEEHARRVLEIWGSFPELDFGEEED